MPYGPSEERVRDALSRWARPDSVEVRRHHQAVNAVLEVRLGGATFYLRLTPTSWRSRADVACELAFVGHLVRRGCRVASPIPSSSGSLVEEVSDWFATMYERAPGVSAEPGGAAWEEAMFRAWGEALARQHLAAQDFDVPAATWRRDWRAEPVLVRGVEALRRTDPAAHEAAEDVLEAVEREAEGLGTVGMIHADFAPQNFRWSSSGGITAFDFDNACRHWLFYDLTVARLVLARFDHPERLLGWIVSGYETLAPLPGDPSLIDVLARLRLLYVLCDRLWTADGSGSGSQEEALRRLRGRFLHAADVNERGR